MYRFARHGATAAAMLLLGATLSAPSHANQFVGDLVYCDVDANGRFDGADYKLNGVEVRVTCQDGNGATCFDQTSTTGVLSPTVSAGDFDAVCGALAGHTSSDLAGRYRVEILGVNGAAPGCLDTGSGTPPFHCSVSVNEATLPATCNGLVTPIVGMPADGNNDGDWCDAEDGPFAEGQILGDSSSSQAACQAAPSPGPLDGIHHTVQTSPGSRCSLYADFGYAPMAVGGPTRTPGFWKNHPDATEGQLPVEYCGRDVEEVCDAVGLLGQQGGGLNAFARHAIAAQLNCAAFGCSADIAAVVDEGNAACAARSRSYDYSGAAAILDEFNNSGESIATDFNFGPADPKFCRSGGPGHHQPKHQRPYGQKRGCRSHR